MWKARVIDLSAGPSTVSAVPAKVYGIYVNDAVAGGGCDIKNGATTVFVVPDDITAGGAVVFAGEEGVIFSDSVTVDPTAVTGSFTILYKDNI
jgi:hypothetical protein